MSVSPLDYIAAGYWQDCLADRPIAGGIAYEAALRACILDESLISLQRIDTLLSQIRRDMMKRGKWDEAALLDDEHYRNLIVFVGFYAGRVLAGQWQSEPHWYGQFELRKRYPALSLTTDDFYQHMAVVYRKDAKDDAAASLFFALEPIGLRLFGHIDRSFEAVQGGQVASGLYHAVSARLAQSDDSCRVESPIQPTAQMSETNTETQRDTNQNSQIAQPSEAKLPDKMPIESRSSTPIERATNKALSTETTQTKPSLSQAVPLSRSAKLDSAKLESDKPASAAATVTKPVLLSKSAPLSKMSPTPEIFTQLLTELEEIEVLQTAGGAEYQQACQVLTQFEQHIAKQHKPRTQIGFSESHLAAKKQALLTLQSSANAGNTSAMLRLAMYELLGEGLTGEDVAEDKKAMMTAGGEWVKQAASRNDSRAQRLLSKLYYQGLGVTQDIDSGKYWLEQAAENGHTDAANLLQQWQQAQVLITTQQQEQSSFKRYQLLFGAVAVVAILIIVMV